MVKASGQPFSCHMQLAICQGLEFFGEMFWKDGLETH